MHNKAPQTIKLEPGVELQHLENNREMIYIAETDSTLMFDIDSFMAPPSSSNPMLDGQKSSWLTLPQFI